MMKRPAILSVFLCFFSANFFSACTPADVDPLSQEDKDFVAQQRNKGRTQGQAVSKVRPTFPQRVDLSLGLLMLDREAEALRIFNLAQKLVNSTEDRTQLGCVRVRRVKEQEYSLTSELCSSQFMDVGFQQSGKAILKLRLNEKQEIESLSYQTVPLADKDLGVTEYQVNKKNLKMGFVVRDQVDLLIERVHGGGAEAAAPAEIQYRIPVYTAKSAYVQSVDFLVTEGVLGYEADGEWTVKEDGTIQSRFHAQLRVRSEVTQTGSTMPGGDSYFDLVIDSYKATQPALMNTESCGRSGGVYEYNLSYGRNSRKGTLILMPDALIANSSVASPEKGKPAKEESQTLGLSKCNGRTPLAWDQLLVPPVPIKK